MALGGTVYGAGAGRGPAGEVMISATHRLVPAGSSSRRRAGDEERANNRGAHCTAAERCALDGRSTAGLVPLVGATECQLLFDAWDKAVLGERQVSISAVRPASNSRWPRPARAPRQQPHRQLAGSCAFTSATPRSTDRRDGQQSLSSSRATYRLIGFGGLSRDCGPPG